jgi:hypothetical protein
MSEQNLLCAVQLGTVILIQRRVRWECAVLSLCFPRDIGAVPAYSAGQWELKFQSSDECRVRGIRDDFEWITDYEIEFTMFTSLVVFTVSKIHASQLQALYNRDSAVGLNIRFLGFWVLVGGRISSPRRPDRFWGPSSLLFKRHRGLFPRGKAAGT